VNLTVMTPYPGTEIWHTEAQKLTSLDYRLFDIQHAVLPTKLPLDVFYQELVKTQSVLNRKHLGVAAVAQTFGIIGRNLMHGQTTSPGCCGSSTRSTTPRANTATTNVKCATSCRHPSTTRSDRKTGASSTSTVHRSATAMPPQIKQGAHGTFVVRFQPT